MNKLGVTLGSVFGVLASGLGIVAVLFPDALNLQKNKIQKFEAEIDTRADVDALDAFLRKNVNRVVEVSLAVCGSREQSSKAPVIHLEDNSLQVYHDDCEADSICTSDTFYFSAPDQPGASIWGWDKFEDCKTEGEFGVLGFSGYFIVPGGAGFGQGSSEWMLNPIDSKEIALKQY